MQHSLIEEYEGEDSGGSRCCQKVKQLELKIRKLQREVQLVVLIHLSMVHIIISMQIELCKHISSILKTWTLELMIRATVIQLLQVTTHLVWPFVHFFCIFCLNYT